MLLLLLLDDEFHDVPLLLLLLHYYYYYCYNSFSYSSFASPRSHSSSSSRNHSNYFFLERFFFNLIDLLDVDSILTLLENPRSSSVLPSNSASQWTLMSSSSVNTVLSLVISVAEGLEQRAAL